MGSIPLPALAIKPTEQPDILGNYGKMAALKSAGLQQQIEQQNIEQNQLSLQSEKAIQKAYTEAQGDPDQTLKLAAKYGAKPQALMGLNNAFMDQKLKTLQLVQANGAEAKRQADLMQGAHDAVDSADPKDRPMAYQSQLMGLQKQGVDVSQLPQQYPGDEAFKVIGALVKGHTQQVEDSLKQGEARRNNAQAAVDELKVKGLQGLTPQSISDTVDRIFPPTDPNSGGPNRMTKAMALGRLQSGDPAGAQKAIEDGFQSAMGVQKDIAVATNPQIQGGKIAVATAEGQARANIEAAQARGSNAALSNVPPHLVAPATASATKAGEEYAQAKSVSDRLTAVMDAANRGNVVSYKVIPEEGALQIVTTQGVHRINFAEIQSYGGGSALQRLEGYFGKQATGKSIPDSVLKDMGEIQDIMARGSKEKYNNSLKTINEAYGSSFKPAEMSNLPNTTTQPQNNTQAKPIKTYKGHDYEQQDDGSWKLK